MALTHSIIRGWQSAGGAAINSTISVQAGSEQNIDESLIAGATNQLIDFALITSGRIKALFIVCDQAVTIKTNSSGSPANTFSLAANTPFTYVTGDATLHDTTSTVVDTAVPITKLYATNGNADEAALLQIRCLIDPTA